MTEPLTVEDSARIIRRYLASWRLADVVSAVQHGPDAVKAERSSMIAGSSGAHSRELTWETTAKGVQATIGDRAGLTPWKDLFAVVRDAATARPLAAARLTDAVRAIREHARTYAPCPWLPACDDPTGERTTAAREAWQRDHADAWQERSQQLHDALDDAVAEFWGDHPATPDQEPKAGQLDLFDLLKAVTA